jgi:uncharacterized membrane protein YkvA (DUF1232 family)
MVRRRRLIRRKRSGSLASMLRLLPKLLKLLVKLFQDARVSIFDRALFATVIAYVLTPIDLLPDWLGMLGLTDDLYLVGLSLSRLLRGAGPDLLLKYWEGSPKALGYLIESIEEIGAKLPRAIQGFLRGTVFGK